MYPLVKQASFWLIFIIISSSCGYRLAGTISTLPSHIKTVSIPVFKNLSSEPGIEKKITNLVKERFIIDKRLKVDEITNSDLLINGVINNFYLKPVSFDSSDNVTEYWIVIEVHITAKDIRNNKYLIDKNLSAKWDYKVSSSLTSNEASRINAFKEAFDDLSKKLLNIIIEGF